MKRLKKIWKDFTTTGRGKSGIINDDYAWEIFTGRQIRQFKDGIIFCDFNIGYDRYLADHTPRFEFSLFILNHTIVEFNYYYRHHRE